MFVPAALAARIDRVEAGLGTALVRAVAARDPAAGSSVVPIAGGAAVFVRPGSPANKLVGLGFEPVAEDALGAIEEAWAAHGERVRIELASLASIATFDVLATRGYRLRGFECVHVRALDAAPAMSEIAIERSAGAWGQIALDGFTVPDGTGESVDQHGRAAIEAALTDMQHASGFHHYVAHLDGAPAGAALMRIDDGIALLCGATTLPAVRRRGIQAALLGRRLADARAAGAELAVMITAPGSRSQHNAIRNGFVLGYLRAILER